MNMFNWAQAGDVSLKLPRSYCHLTFWKVERRAKEINYVSDTVQGRRLQMPMMGGMGAMGGMGGMGGGGAALSPSGTVHRMQRLRDLDGFGWFFRCKLVQNFKVNVRARGVEMLLPGGELDPVQTLVRLLWKSSITWKFFAKETVRLCSS